MVGTIAPDRRRQFGVDVRVFDASRIQVASEYVPPRDDRFRFELPPGEYQLLLTNHLAPGNCHNYAKAVSVRASLTTHITFLAGVLTPGCGTY